jgi:hypothetical protein
MVKKVTQHQIKFEFKRIKFKFKLNQSNKINIWFKKSNQIQIDYIFDLIWFCGTLSFSYNSYDKIFSQLNDVKLM